MATSTEDLLHQITKIRDQADAATADETADRQLAIEDIVRQLDGVIAAHRSGRTVP